MAAVVDGADVLNDCLPQNLSGKGRAADSPSGAMCCPELEEREKCWSGERLLEAVLIADDDDVADAPSSDDRGS